ncbi:hypothetical protein NEOLI_002371 [Neolecta irregularis DAH-3]|uniref:Uncharacterized protein n=1 Tax=Neolecta irregularis (strain DAH-3) TaxID=1198029 RepID=A0A1U7LPE6_NEOID|nr:hypothetical protein NEOLI_002371 [Neolecta irregularis DAH-3]|eukprot:OLL24509.1 hypothetical protein NEOLI_002371 [Neolecta irregularis DAH-3]
MSIGFADSTETPSPGQATSTLYFLPDDVVPLGSSTDTVGGGSHSKIDESSLQWDLAVQYHLSEMGYIKIPLPPHFLQDNPVSDIRGTPFAIDEVDWDDILKAPDQSPSTLDSLPKDLVHHGSSAETVGGGSHSEIDELLSQWDPDGSTETYSH